MQRYIKTDKGEMEKYDIGGWVMYKDVFEEIESLRSELKETVQAHADEERRGDEWKRLAELMWKWMHKTWCENLKFSKVSDDYRDHNPEAADWFEEE